ncbi:MAG: hypothetical protein WEB03_13915 [Nitriliruptor sp.]|uniref:hypothetical protein n=1 Tax=Nitriliruptor sp. TaxID=2448056 RepID=UPI0034A04AAA
MLAHALWFTDVLPPLDWAFARAPLSLLAIGLAVVGALVWRWVAARLPTPELGFLRPLGRLGPFVPRLLGVHAGVSLLAQASRFEYLVPALELPTTWWGAGLGILEGVVGVWLIAGWRVRPAAWLLVLAGPLGMLGYGIVPILERADLLGIGLFLALLPPDDSRPLGAIRIDLDRIRRAVLGLRVLVGVALIVLAFTEKLARPDLALEFLSSYPAFNILQLVGLPISDLQFVQFAAGVEILFGLLLISGAAPQSVVLVAGVPFNATLFFLGATELIGHLPIYGAMLALLILGSRDDTAPGCSWLPGLGTAGRPRTPDEPPRAVHGVSEAPSASH